MVWYAAEFVIRLAAVKETLIACRFKIGRHYHEEPGAVVPHAGICAGAAMPVAAEYCLISMKTPLDAINWTSWFLEKLKEETNELRDQKK